MKKGVLTLASLFLMNFVSAYNGYGSFSLQNFFDSIDSSTMILGLLFLIFFSFLNFSLAKFFKDNKALSGVVSFAASLLIIYGLSKTGFDFQSILFEIGISESFLYTFLPIIILIATIVLFWKFGSHTFGVLGALLIIISFTDVIYEKGVSLMLGFVLLVIWGAARMWAGKKKLP
jgi:hypothetical protein